jgi:hypothetical protein
MVYYVALLLVVSRPAPVVDVLFRWYSLFHNFFSYESMNCNGVGVNIGTVPYRAIHPTIPTRQRYVRACTGHYYMLKKNCERLYAGQWSVVRQTTEDQTDGRRLIILTAPIDAQVK